ncbi:hypothetical protein NKG94_13725 [Micromonospora sp. M12]
MGAGRDPRTGLLFVSTAPRDNAAPDERFVGIDERAAARGVAAHVAGLGHRRVALLADSVLPGAPAGPLTLAGWTRCRTPPPEADSAVSPTRSTRWASAGRS